jgi:hypothetical protein
MKKVLLSALVLPAFLAAPAAAASPLARHYVEGETFKYRITGKMVNNGRDYSSEAEATVRKSTAGVFYEELKWAVGEEGASVPEDFRQYVSLDPLFKPQMPSKAGAGFLDMLNFYADLWLVIRQDGIRKPGDHAYFKRSLPNSWAWGNTLVGYDCIDFDMTFAELNASSGTAKVLVKHVPPPGGCSRQPPAEWMAKPVADTANNFFQVTKQPDGRYNAGVGKEFFDVDITLEMPSGKMLAATMYNPVTGISRVCSDEKLSDCGEPEPFSLVRNISMELVP